MAHPRRMRVRIAGRKRGTRERIQTQTTGRGDEPNLDESGDRCYGSAAVGSGGACPMSEPQAAPKKPSFWQTLRTGWGPYKRLYAYVKPYRWRFVLGLSLGFAFGVISNAGMPLVIGKVTGAVFQ